MAPRAGDRVSRLAVAAGLRLRSPGVWLVHARAGRVVGSSRSRSRSSRCQTGGSPTSRTSSSRACSRSSASRLEHEPVARGRRHQVGKPGEHDAGAQRPAPRRSAGCGIPAAERASSRRANTSIVPRSGRVARPRRRRSPRQDRPPRPPGRAVCQVRPLGDRSHRHRWLRCAAASLDPPDASDTESRLDCTVHPTTTMTKETHVQGHEGVQRVLGGRHRRARRFYSETLGLDVSEENGKLTLHIAGGRDISCTPRGRPHARRRSRSSTSRSTTSRRGRRPRQRGVEFERYPGMEIDEKGIFRGAGPLIAWFTDPAGNVLSVLQAD